MVGVIILGYWLGKRSKWDLGSSRIGMIYFCVHGDAVCAKVKRKFVRSSKNRKSPSVAKSLATFPGCGAKLCAR